MSRLSGRAPNTGSKPSSESRSTAARRELERDLALGEPRADLLELQLDDLADLLERERVEHHDVVDAVEELGPERRAQRLLAACGRVSLLVGAALGELLDELASPRCSS